MLHLCLRGSKFFANKFKTVKGKTRLVKCLMGYTLMKEKNNQRSLRAWRSSWWPIINSVSALKSSMEKTSARRASSKRAWLQCRAKLNMQHPVAKCCLLCMWLGCKRGSSEATHSRVWLKNLALFHPFIVANDEEQHICLFRILTQPCHPQGEWKSPTSKPTCDDSSRCQPPVMMINPRPLPARRSALSELIVWHVEHTSA